MNQDSTTGIELSSEVISTDNLIVQKVSKTNNESEQLPID